MDTTLKQRILGIIVLVALLGICLTVLLHNNKNPQRNERASIPAKPQIANTNAALLTTDNTPPPANNTNVFNTTPPTPNNTNTTSVTTPTNATTTPPTPITTPTSAATATPMVNQPTAPSSTQTPVVTTANNALNNNATTTPSTTATTTAKPADLYTIPDNSDNTTQATAPVTNNIPTTSKVASIPSSNFTNPPITTNNATNATPSITTSTPAKTSHHKVTATLPAPIHKKETAISNANNGETDLVIQIGSFTLPANAETLVDKLHAKGFTATAQKMQTDKGEMTRVIVGKKGLDHTQAEALRAKLQNDMQIQGFIVSHDPSSTAPIEKKSGKTTAKNGASNAALNDDI